MVSGSGSPSVRARAGGATFLLLAALVSGALVGCDKKTEATTQAASASFNSASTAPVPSLLAVWEKGDKPAAVRAFVETDWTTRPLFASGSTLGLPEAQFKKLSAANREAKFSETVPQTAALKALAREVMLAGREAVSKKEADLGRKHFVSLQQCGDALNTPETLAVVKLIGQAMKKMADAELVKLAP